jgi:hypothetical protein
MTELTHADVLKKFKVLNQRLSVFNMHIYVWSKLSVALNSSPHNNFVLNNITNIDVIEGFVAGLEYKLLQHDVSLAKRDLLSEAKGIEDAYYTAE